MSVALDGAVLDRLHLDRARQCPGRDLLREATTSESAIALPAPSEGEDLVADYASLQLTLGRHPLSLLRALLETRRYLTAATLRTYADNRVARCAGIVTGRQRPGTASGVVFLTLEDETGLANVIVHPKLAEGQRRELLSARLLGVFGVVQRAGEVVHLIVEDSGHEVDVADRDNLFVPYFSTRRRGTGRWWIRG